MCLSLRFDIAWYVWKLNRRILITVLGSVITDTILPHILSKETQAHGISVCVCVCLNHLTDFLEA